MNRGHSAITSFQIGRQAEAVAADYLTARGYRVLQRNWRTRYCEIDLVVQHAQRIVFVEVKYRRRLTQGDGLDYITPAKLQRMIFAAELWVGHYDWTGSYCLAVLSAVGWPMTVERFVEL